MSDYISHDVLTQIFESVPVKSLLKCRSVCKSWRQCIDSSSFRIHHLSLQTPRLIVQKQAFKYLLIDPQTLPSTPFFRTLRGPSVLESKHGDCVLLSTVHGVICLGSKDHIFLWNPSLHRVLILPLPVEVSRRSTYLIHFRGFWIDPSNNHYKFVIFSFKAGTLDIYDSRRRRWIHVTMANVRDYGTDRCRQVVVGTVAYWSARYIGSESFGGVLVYFDFLSNNYGTVELPHEMMVVGRNMDVCKWEECLSIVHWDDDIPHRCDLWAMQNGLWSQMFTFNLACQLRRVLCVVENHGRVLLHNNRGDLILYDATDRLIRRVKSKLIYKSFGFLVAYDLLEESLVFPVGEFISDRVMIEYMA